MKFWKYQGAGNDFIMVDQRTDRRLFRKDTELIARLCDRRFGIGADGLILLESHTDCDFEMIYFNADGRESSMCGNGGRCIAAFAEHLGIVKSSCRFIAIDGLHEAVIVPQKRAGLYWVELKMTDVTAVERRDNNFILNTGSPHFVQFTTQLTEKDMVMEGRAVRYSDAYRAEGVNVNLVEKQDDGSISIRTYERGVEDETLACGTGVTAAALSASMLNGASGDKYDIPVHARGGDLRVRFRKGSQPGNFFDIWLCGPAEYVYSGEIPLDAGH